MSVVEDYRDEKTCALSGDTKELYTCFCINRDAANAGELEVYLRPGTARTNPEPKPPRLPSKNGCWAFSVAGCPTTSIRDDISDMYNHGDFILAPTFKTYMDMRRFMDLAGVKNRRKSDKSQRRPLTALASPRGTYRYVFIPCTEAARALQAELKLQPQTQEDLNGGIYPLDNKPCLEGSDLFPVVECCTHPYSISTLADKVFCKRSTMLTAQWHALAGDIIDQRANKAFDPPRWFINAPKCGDDDMELTPSEATGYQLSAGGKYPVPAPAAILRDVDVPETDFRKAVADWVCNKIDPKAAPPKEKPTRIAYKVRRSDRLRAKACPYERSPTVDGPPPSPTRNGPRAIVTCRRDLTHLPPAWAEHNGEFPTDRFSSNDWAFFCYSVNLAYTPPPKNTYRTRVQRYRLPCRITDDSHDPLPELVQPSVVRLLLRSVYRVEVGEIDIMALRRRGSLLRGRRPASGLAPFNLKPQTRDDLNGGICPVDNKPFRPGSDQFRVVECCAHPFSVSMLAWKVLCSRSTTLTGQWHTLCRRINEQRHNKAISPPQWFIDAPKLSDDDEDLTSSEASGYLLSSCGKYPSPDPASIFRDTSIPETDSRKAIADWACNKIDPKAAPPKEKPIRIAYKVRRSERLRAKACPYDRPPSPDGPPPSPTRNGPRAIVTCRRDLTHLPPAWVEHNGEFPTDRFSSNDWAFFCYNVNLAYTPPKKP
ncbi:hypothetical protein HDZ31DRAFT_47009 [Schizophyllum fasciatum]